MTLKNPLVAAASPLSKKLDTAKRLEEAGISAIVMYSLFEEQIIHESLELDYFLSKGTNTFAESLSYLPDVGMYATGPEGYLEYVRQLKQAVKIPVIGSLNGVSGGGWAQYARLIEQAGADALELNIYYLPTDPDIDAVEMENAYINLVSQVRAQVKFPIAVKISPFFSALPNFCRRLVEAGANGMVLFNRFYQPDFDLEKLEVTPNLVLSSSHELRLPLRWIALMYGKVQADFALSSGIHTAEDVVKAMMAGASVATSASALLHSGIDQASTILDNLILWME
jgi:dihydroorotate dehydrogenase (fumarate)